MLVDAGDSRALAQRIRQAAKNPKMLSQSSARNLAKAKEYSWHELSKRRTAFYRHINEESRKSLEKDP